MKQLGNRATTPLCIDEDRGEATVEKLVMHPEVAHAPVFCESSNRAGTGGALLFAQAPWRVSEKLAFDAQVVGARDFDLLR